MPVSGPAASARRALRIEGHPIAVLVVASLAVGIASLLLSSAPTTDPWGWIVWGRQITHLDLNTVAGPPSWKPLPVLFTTPLSVLGGAAPAAWLVIARAGSLLALGLAYRLGARLAGPAAGVVALVSLLLMQEWLSDAAFGYSEGLAVALLLWAVISHLEGRYTRALTLGFLVSLSRPEAWAFFFPYAAFTCLTGRSRRSVAIGLAIASPLLWVLPDWWGSGDPFHAAHVAGVNLAAAGAYPGLGVLRGALGLVALPVELLALAAVALAARRRDATVAILGLAAAAWVALLALATEAGYPGAGRFLVLPLALVCVLAGVGAMWLVELGRPAVPRAVVAALMVAAALPLLAGRADDLTAQAGHAGAVARFQGELGVAFQRAAGRLALLRYGRPVLPAHLWWNAGALAWKLDIPLERVARIGERRLATLGGLNAPSVLFTPLGAAPPEDPQWVPTRHVGRPNVSVLRLARAGTWSVLAIEPKGSRAAGRHATRTGARRHRREDVGPAPA